MNVITKEDIKNSDNFMPVLKKTLHGQLVEKEKLSTSEVKYCKNVNWIEPASKFKCSICKNWHTVHPGEFRCLTNEVPVDPKENFVKRGFRRKPDLKLDFTTEEYSFFLRENSDVINIQEIPKKSLVFVPLPEQNFSFLDRVGAKILLPMEGLTKVVKEEELEKLIFDIEEKRKNRIQWSALDDQGENFEEIIYRLVKRDDGFNRESWGGCGVDQGKDGFCSVDVGDNRLRVLIQSKFNSKGSGINDDTIRKYQDRAKDNDCQGLLIAAIKVTGYLETQLNKDTYNKQEIPYLRVWSGPDIKEKISKHPDLIEEYFIK